MVVLAVLVNLVRRLLQAAKNIKVFNLFSRDPAAGHDFLSFLIEISVLSLLLLVRLEWPLSFLERVRPSFKSSLNQIVFEEDEKVFYYNFVKIKQLSTSFNTLLGPGQANWPISLHRAGIGSIIGWAEWSICQDMSGIL